MLMSGRQGMPPTVAIELTTDHQHRVSQFLGRQSTWLEGRVELAQRIFVDKRLGIRMPAIAAVRVGGDDQVIELLDRPSIVHEPRGQIIKEFGVRRQTTGTAEVVRIARDAFAEVPRPDTIDNDSGGQRIGGIDDPVGQCQAAFSLGHWEN